METVSKTQSSVGRPCVIHAALEPVITFAVGPYTSQRTRQNFFYQLEAMKALGLTDNPFPGPYRWLCDSEKQKEGGSERRGFKKTILSELGRIEDLEEMRAVALRLCELKPKTKDAVLMIRSYLCGGKPKSDTLQLANEIIRTVNDYLQRHSDISREQIFDALHTATVQIKEAEFE